MSRKIIMLLMAVPFNAMTRTLFTVTVGFSPGIDAVGVNAVGALMGIYGNTIPILRVGVYTEIRIGELAKILHSGLAGSRLDGVSDQSSIVDNGVIHLVEVGAGPNVLINNTIYPIPMQALEDKDIAISPDKFQSKVTPITDDGLYATSYDKMARVKESHGSAINDAEFAEAAYALYATEHTAKIPVLGTTGDADEKIGRKHLTPNNLMEMKCALDKLKVPFENHRLVLCPDHVNDLLLVGQNFREQYNINRNTGKVGNPYGFQVYECGNNPVYTTAGEKKAMDATSDTREFQCSFAFYTSHVFKATGNAKMYFSEAQKDPEYQHSKISFRHYFVCVFKKTDTDVVMMSGYAASELPEG